MRSRARWYFSIVSLLAACEADAGAATGSSCPPGSALTYVSFGKTFLDRYCVSCHASTNTGSARHGAPPFHDYDTVDGVRNTLDHIDQVAAAGPDTVNTVMPPTSPRPTEAERRQLGEWLACGAP